MGSFYHELFVRVGHFLHKGDKLLKVSAMGPKVFLCCKASKETPENVSSGCPSFQVSAVPILENRKVAKKSEVCLTAHNSVQLYREISSFCHFVEKRTLYNTLVVAKKHRYMLRRYWRENSKNPIFTNAKISPFPDSTTLTIDCQSLNFHEIIFRTEENNPVSKK